METIAVYWEAKIRTYGFHLAEGLRMFQIGVASRDLEIWGQALQEMADQGTGFRLVWAQRGSADRVDFFLLCGDDHWRTVLSFLEHRSDPEGVAQAHAPTPVDLILFQGPHYGDRYGVLDFALTPLAEAQLPVLAVACSVATICLVFPAGRGAAARGVLTTAFEIPCQAGN